MSMTYVTKILCLSGVLATIIAIPFSVISSVLMDQSSPDRASKTEKLVIDNDAGGDDAVAIFLALLNAKYFNGPEVIGLTTVNGNTNENNVCTNNQKILKIAEKDVHIYRGAQRSLVTTPLAGAYFGEDGLGDTDDEYKDLVETQQQPAALALLELSKKYRGQLTVISIGPVTNVALAISLDPSFLGRLKHLYIGAGHIHDNKNQDAEFNAHMDVEAYHIISQNATPEKVTIVPFSQVRTNLNLSKKWRNEVLGALNTDIIKNLNKFERVALSQEETWTVLDPAIVAAVLNPDLVEEYKYSKNDIIMCGEDRGKNTNILVSDKDDANVRVIYKFKPEEVKQFYIDIFSAELAKSSW